MNDRKRPQERSTRSRAAPRLSLGLAHEVGLAASMTVAFLLVLLGGELPVVAWLVLGAPVVSAVMRTRGRSAPASSGTLLALVSLVLGFVQIFTGGVETAVLGGGIALIGILAARLITRTTAEHDLQALLLSLLVVMAGSVLNVGLNYGPLFVVYSLCTIWALTTRELLFGAASTSEGEVESLTRARTDVVTPGFFAVTGGVALVVLLATGLIFLAFPRVGIGSLGNSSGGTGVFPSSVNLSGAARGAGGNDVVARVRGVDEDTFERGLYLRGAVYEVVDGAGFSQREPAPRLAQASRDLARAPVQEVYEVYTVPVSGTLLLSLGPVVQAQTRSGGHPNPNRRVRVQGQNTRGELVASSKLRTAIRLRISGGISAPGYVPDARPRPSVVLAPGKLDHAVFYSLPEDFDPRVRDLAEQVTAGAATVPDKVSRLRAFMLEQFNYTLDQPNRTSSTPLFSFLLEDRRGHCEYFAAAFTVMLRALGIPARVVGGYQGGAWDDVDDVVVFSERNAHAWVEWFLEGQGWIVDDPTPVAGAVRERLAGWRGLLERLQRGWDERVLEYALTDQIDGLRQLQASLSGIGSGDFERNPRVAVGLLVGVAGVVLVFLWRRRRHRRRNTAHPLAEALLGVVAEARGTPVGDAETLREAVGSLAGRPLTGRDALEVALHLYEADRFGGHPVDDVDVAAAVEALREVAPPRASG